METQNKKCYVCHAKVENTTHSILNPKVNTKWWTPPERPICGNTSYRPRLCYSVLRQLASWGKCSDSCCVVGHMTNFDLDKHIKEIKSGKYLKEYNQWATNLFHQVGRITK